MTSKRRSLLSLIFIIKCYKNNILIRNLKRDNQLQLFRRLEQSSKKHVNCLAAVEFLKLCQNLSLTPTFAKVDSTKAYKFKKSSSEFETNVVNEELRQKKRQAKKLGEEISQIYDEIR